MSRLPVTIERPSAAPAPDVPPRTGRLTAEVRGGLDLRPDDAAALDALVDARPQVGIFLSRPWLAGLFHEPPPGATPSLVLLRDGGALRGVVALAVRQARTHLRVGLLGGGCASDRVDLLAARGFEAACADAFVAWLGEAFGRRGVVLELRDVAADSPLWGAVCRANAGAAPRFALQPLEIHTLPYLDLTEPAPAGAGRPMVPGDPQSFEKHRRWLERRGRLRVELLRDSGEVMAAFEALAAWLRARWSRTDDGSALDRPWAGRFHRRVAPLLLGDGRLRMLRLSIDARAVGVFYGLAAGGWRGYYLAGYDRAWAGRIHLGRILLAAAVQQACGEGAGEFDFLKGAEPIKYLWPVRERSSVDADAYPAHAASQLARARWAAREAASASIRSVCGLLSGLGRS